MSMIDHNFIPVTFWVLGPLKNPNGYTITIAEIDAVWIMKWREPWSNVETCRHFSDYQKVIEEVKKLY